MGRVHWQMTGADIASQQPHAADRGCDGCHGHAANDHAPQQARLALDRQKFFAGSDDRPGRLRRVDELQSGFRSAALAGFGRLGRFHSHPIDNRRHSRHASHVVLHQLALVAAAHFANHGDHAVENFET
jgi:hypothetical protein